MPACPICPVDPCALPRRILLYGVTGSGKTTLAKRLGDVSSLPWQEADYLTWEPNWVQVPGAEQRRRLIEFCDQPTWILDTAYAQWIDVPLARAELIIALDYPRWISLSRLVSRTVSRVADRQTVCNGNIETLANTFSRDSILLWHFRSFKRKRSRICALEAASEGPPVLRFQHPRQADMWLNALSRSSV